MTDVDELAACIQAATRLSATHHVGLAGARIAEHAQVRRPLDELTLGQTSDLGANRCREASDIERRHRLVVGKLRLGG